MTNNRSKMSLADLSQAFEQAERLKLTKDNKVKFKITFNSQLEEMYSFGTIHDITDPDSKKQLDNEEKIFLYSIFGQFIDKTVNRSITNVEANYARDDDLNDHTYDPVGGEHKQTKHFSLDEQRKSKFRIHGYYNDYGYFVVTRMDWCHTYHLRRDRQCRERT